MRSMMLLAIILCLGGLQFDVSSIALAVDTSAPLFAQIFRYTESSTCDNNLHTEISIVPLEVCIKAAPTGYLRKEIVNKRYVYTDVPEGFYFFLFYYYFYIRFFPFLLHPSYIFHISLYWIFS